MKGVIVSTLLRAEALTRYDELHRSVPTAVEESIRAAGIDDWTIWREGRVLRQLVICRDLAQFEDAGRAQPREWLDSMRTLVDPTQLDPAPLVVDVPWRLRRK